MKKKFSVIFILLSFLMIMTFFSKPINTFALSKTETSNFELVEKSKSAYLMDSKTKTKIYSKNEDKRLPIASMCKIMTLLLTFEAIDNGFMNYDDVICVSENASSMGGSQVFLETNGNYSIKDLIKSVTVASANDASVALAEHISGSERAFVDKMNDKAEELGMNNTLFANCTGLPKPTQYSSAKDVATMFNELINHEKYYEFSTIWMDEISHPEGRVTSISNTNKLIKFYNGCDAGKTGYTSEAGHCVTASAMRDGMRLISVIISAPDGKTRFKEASDMFNYGFSNYENKIIVDENKELNDTVSVIGGKSQTVNVKPKNSLYLFNKKGEKVAVEITFEKNKNVKAPVNEGDVLGKIIVYGNDGIEINQVDVVASSSVERASYYDSINKAINNWSVL